MKKNLLSTVLTVTLMSFGCNANAQVEPVLPKNRPANGELPIRRELPKFDVHHPSVHDPVMAYENGRYYVFSTGVGISVMSSEDLITWKEERPVFRRPPSWAVTAVDGYHGHTWAPDIIKGEDGLWHLYYSCSTFAKNRSVIGEAVNKTLDANSPDFEWIDKGMVVESVPKKTNFNAIDPNVIIDEKGNPWMTFGSFWGGIQLFKLKKDMHTAASKKPKTIARRKSNISHYGKKNNFSTEPKDNAVEAPFIIRHGDYYYLFVSFDYCCRGNRSDYKTAVGRSKKITGPYLDKEGRRMDKGGGTVIYSSDEDYVAVGHNSVYNIPLSKAISFSPADEWLFVAHGYLREGRGESKLMIRRLIFTDDDWVVVGDKIK